MKKKYQLLWLIILLLPLPTKALSLECPTRATQGEEIICQVTENEFIGATAKFQFDPIFTYISMDIKAPWKRYYVGSLGFNLGNITTNDPLTGSLHLKIDHKAQTGKEYNLVLTEIEKVNSEFKNIQQENIIHKIKIVSDINTLNNLKINNGELKPKFDPNRTSYQATTQEESVTIEATPTDKSAKLEGDLGKQKLNYGINHFIVKVTSERGNQRLYNLYITRTKSTSSQKSDITLKQLVVNNTNIKLEKNKFYYEFAVENKIETIEIEAKPTQESSKVTVIKPEKLEVGENEIKIQVTGIDGTEGTYILKVTRKKKLSADATIKSLVIDHYDLNFVTNKYDYNLTIKEENKLTIKVVLNDSNAKYQIQGNHNLKNNSIIKIIVTAEDQTKKTYTIKIQKEIPPTNSIINNIKIVPLIGFILLISTILIIKILRTKLLKKNNN